MKGIVIRSKSKKGNEALVINQKDTQSARFLDRKQYQLTYKVRFDNAGRFYELYLFGRSKYITPSLTRPVAYDMMLANGAEYNKDFVIEEVEE